MSGVWILFAVGLAAGLALRVGYRRIPRSIGPAEALRAFAERRGALVRGDGRVEALTVVGHVQGRAFTLAWQRPRGGGDVLLVGVDCLAAAEGALGPSERAAGAEVTAGEAALVLRWVRPDPALFDDARLAVLLEEAARLAEELEVSHGNASDLE